MLEAIKCRWSFYIFLVISFAVLHGEPSRDPPANGRKEELKKLLFGCADDLNFGRDLSRVASRCLAKLRQGLEEQAGLYEDSNEHWSIRAYRAYLHDNDRMYFRSLSYFSERSKQRKCHVTQVELLVPVVQSPKVKENWISIQVDGKMLKYTSRSNDTSDVISFSHVLTFDLPGLHADNIHDVNITMSSPSFELRLIQSLEQKHCRLVKNEAEKTASCPADIPEPEPDEVPKKDTKDEVIPLSDDARERVRLISQLIKAAAEKSLKRRKDHDDFKYRDDKNTQPTLKINEPNNACSVTPGSEIPQHCLCKRERLYVKMPNDVIAPKAIDVGYCKGACDHVTKFYQMDGNITGHAVLLNKQKKLTKCAPHRMADMKLQVLNTSRMSALDDVILKDVTVKTCRCT
ncbi:uncharacterized protein LOC131936403 isoform X2 [Physella acuta]|uniref:uncharacterized protein LOC131936403 isoform X2 n=1 Tax=Physella acuta TaxID=109671 RepID=UPI0027DE61BD|nr:uncharacterized protein LOC131936403 isoform X2 [Physella acuta]